jgi:hypothetical protein
MYYLKALKECLEENTPNSLILLFSTFSTFHPDGLRLIFIGWPNSPDYREGNLSAASLPIFPDLHTRPLSLWAGTRLMHDVHCPAWRGRKMKQRGLSIGDFPIPQSCNLLTLGREMHNTTRMIISGSQFYVN